MRYQIYKNLGFIKRNCTLCFAVLNLDIFLCSSLLENVYNHNQKVHFLDLKH